MEKIKQYNFFQYLRLRKESRRTRQFLRNARLNIIDYSKQNEPDEVMTETSKDNKTTKIVKDLNVCKIEVFS